MEIKNVLVVYAGPTSRECKLTLGKVRNILKKYKVNYKIINRGNLSRKIFENSSLIIAVGGDGTFLRAAQFIRNQFLFGVNADVKNKEGFLMNADKANFGKKIRKILNGRFKIAKLQRLEAYINNKKIETLALNEFFVGPIKSYHAAKYVIKVDGVKERQKSSGILVSTPIGSRAWANSCCNKALPLNSKNFQFIVREPYQGKIFKNYKLKYGVLRKHQKLNIISEMLDGILIADSVGKEYRLKNGSKVTIRLSNDHLNTIWVK